MRNIAESLWSLLDDIDTASDIFKPCERNGMRSYEKFYNYVMKKAAKRFDYLKSDGYEIYTPEEYALLPVKEHIMKDVSKLDLSENNPGTEESL